SRQRGAHGAGVGAAKRCRLLRPSTTGAGNTCTAGGARSSAPPPPITAAYHGMSIQAAAMPATTDPAVTIIETHRTAGPEPCAIGGSREVLGKCPLAERS